MDNILKLSKKVNHSISNLNHPNSNYYYFIFIFEYMILINEMILCFYEFAFEGCIKDNLKITMIMNNNNSKRTTHFIQNGKMKPHTIINIPYSGVYIGVCI
jgi:hypothetical protein